MHDESKQATPESRPTFSRRKLLRAGAAASPVVLTLASTPVAATTGTCTVASSFVSVATFKSRNPTGSAQCTTWGCEQWKTECGNANSSFKSSLDVTVAAAFGSTGCQYDARTLRSILQDGSGINTASELGVVQHLAALGLGVTHGKVASPGNLSTTYIKGVWANYRSNGGKYILSSSGINWTSAQLISWARMLMYTNP